ncbi:hypothetical protein HRbin15_00990 [bacterium HR15]|nr:hypothetical protein HRbin15_00990 [bacterium HR15]
MNFRTPSAPIDMMRLYRVYYSLVPETLVGSLARKEEIMNKNLHFGHRVLVTLASLCLALFLSHCGGGGGGGITGGLNIVGDVFAPQGTPRSRSLAGSALPNATVKAYLLQRLDNPLAQAQTDANGRYTLTLPAQYAGNDLVIIAEKSVQNRTVRLMTILASTPREGKMGVDLNADTTLASEEILRLVHDGNLASPLSPNGVASVIDQVRQWIDEQGISSLDLTVGGGLLPDTPGTGLQGSLGSDVRTLVQQQRNNLTQSTDNDVRTAKRMSQIMRDQIDAFLGSGDDEQVGIEEAVHRQETVVREEIISPTEAFMERIRFAERVLGFDNRWNISLIGMAPGHYREESTGSWPPYRLRRVGDTDNRTWRVDSTLPDTQGMTLTITTQNPLARFEWTSDAGAYTLTVRRAGDSMLQYDGSLRVVERDQTGNPTRISWQVTLRDKDLRAPIQFTGEVSGTPGSGNIPFDSLALSGTLSSQFGMVTLQGLQGDLYASGNPRQIRLSRAQVQSATSRPVSLQVTNLSLTLTDSSEHPQPTAAAASLTLEGEGVTLDLSNWQATFEQVNGEALPKTARAAIGYRSPRMTFQGNFSGQWENPRSELPPQRREDVPKGRFTFTGTLTPRYGAPAAVQITLNSNPDGPAPEVNLSLRLSYGTESVAGDVKGTLNFSGGWLDWRTLFQPVEISLTHSPSNFTLQARAVGDRNRDVSGTIKNSSGEVVAQIGKARDLGLPDFGDTLIVKYKDGSFETLGSLIRR